VSKTGTGPANQHKAAQLQQRQRGRLGRLDDPKPLSLAKESYFRVGNCMWNFDAESHSTWVPNVPPRKQR
jgi:hypothetical protein